MGNAYLMKLAAAENKGFHLGVHAGVDILNDAAVMTVFEVLGVREDEMADFFRKLEKNEMELAELVNLDEKDDEEIVYAKDRVDRVMQEACGKHFAPWDVRHNREKIEAKANKNANKKGQKKK